MSSQDKELRFKPDHEGMLKFLQELKQIWDILMLLARGPVGQTPEIQRFIHRKEQITRFARLIIEGKLDSFVRTLTSGSHLIDNIEDYIESIVESSRVTLYADAAFAKVKGISHGTWNKESDTLNKLYALFVQVDQGENSDLGQVVVAYNDLVLAINQATERALAAKKVSEETAQRALEIRNKRERMERVKASSREILAQLG